MNVTPRNLFPRKPARYDQREFQRLLKLLPDNALDQLEAAVRDMDRNGSQVNIIAATKALLRHSIAKISEAVPTIPDDLLPYTHPELDGGREYGLLINIDPTDLHANIRVRRQYIREIERVRDMVEDGMDATEAWRRVARRSVFDDAMPSLPDRPRRRSQRRVRLDDDD